MKWLGRSMFVALVLLGVSCGDGRLATYPVVGHVVCEGESVDQAVVVFHPRDGSEALESLRPNGRTDADGSFRLKTYVHDDGAPLGEYRVTIEWPGEDPAIPVDPHDPEYAPFGPDQLGGRYADPQTTPLSASISKGTNELPPFEVEK